MPLYIATSSLAGVHAASHADTSSRQQGDRVEGGRFISALTVRLQGALRLHQFTQQIGTAQSMLLHLPHVSPLHVNNRAVRVTTVNTAC